MIYGFLAFGRVRITSRLVSSPWRGVLTFTAEILSVSHFSKAVREPSTIESKHKIEEQILMFLLLCALNNCKSEVFVSLSMIP